METLMLTPAQINIAADFIKKGGLVAMPTETVYGLAADATNGKAVKSIFEAKGRPSDNPLIVHVSSKEEMYPLITNLPSKAELLIKSFCPGPLTIVLPKSDKIPPEVSGGLDTVALRFPAHPAARELIRTSGVPLAAPSANLSGSPSPTTANHVKKDLNGRIHAIIDGGPCAVGLESTVISLAGDTPRLLRPGGITVEEMRRVIGEIIIDSAVTNPLKDGEKVSSPGMKYKHYSPKAKVIIIRGSTEAYINFVNSKKASGVFALCYDEDIPKLNISAVSYGIEYNYENQAQRLFDALRELDEKNARLVYARCPDANGVGLAVYNRLIRAAGFEVLNLA